MEINYEKTITTNRIVFSGQKTEKSISIINIFVINAICLSCAIILPISILSINDKGFFEYFVSVLLFILPIALVFITTKNIINRDKLKEIKINIDFNIAKVKILEASNNINWKQVLITNNYYLLSTSNGFNKSEIISIIFYPDNRIYFNSMDLFRELTKPARFEDNYEDITIEYSKLERDFIQNLSLKV
jgi:hypothetical protein